MRAFMTSTVLDKATTEEYGVYGKSMMHSPATQKLHYDRRSSAKIAHQALDIHQAMLAKTPTDEKKEEDDEEKQQSPPPSSSFKIRLKMPKKSVEDVDPTFTLATVCPPKTPTRFSWSDEECLKVLKHWAKLYKPIDFQSKLTT